MNNNMKLSMLALMVGTVFSTAAQATASEPESQQSIYIRLKAEPSEAAARGVQSSKRAQEMASLQSIAKGMRPLISASPFARNTKAHAALARHNLTRYYRISGEELQGKNASQLVQQLRAHPLVESAQIEPGLIEPITIISPAAKSRLAGIADYTDCQGDNIKVCQGYMGPATPSRYWKLGGVNGFEAQRISGSLGSRVRVISAESTHWDHNHVDLPKPFLQNGDNPTGQHDTASAGIMFGQDNGFGITGLVPHAQAGHSKPNAADLINLIDLLEPGDVLQLGAVTRWGGAEMCGEATKVCSLPAESLDVNFDTISYLTQEKGVHVIMPTGNDAIDLDAPYHKGRYDRKVRDSGAIYVGASDPSVGDRAFYSTYGSRVDLFTWGFNVTTTDWHPQSPGAHQGYTTDYNGTSAANPIIAGAVALMQSVAREQGLGNIPPKEMRQLLIKSGKPLPIVDPEKNIGVQPDLVKALELLGDSGETVWQSTSFVIPSYETLAPGDRAVFKVFNNKGQELPELTKSYYHNPDKYSEELAGAVWSYRLAKDHINKLDLVKAGERQQDGTFKEMRGDNPVHFAQGHDLARAEVTIIHAEPEPIQWQSTSFVIPSTEVLHPGDKVLFKVFNNQGEVPELRKTYYHNAGKYNEDLAGTVWSYRLAKDHINKLEFVKAGQLQSDGSFRPVRGDNPVHFAKGHGFTRVEVSIIRANGGE